MDDTAPDTTADGFIEVLEYTSARRQEIVDNLLALIQRKAKETLASYIAQGDVVQFLTEDELDYLRGILASPMPSERTFLN